MTYIYAIIKTKCSTHSKREYGQTSTFKVLPITVNGLYMISLIQTDLEGVTIFAKDNRLEVYTVEIALEVPKHQLQLSTWDH